MRFLNAAILTTVLSILLCGCAGDSEDNTEKNRLTPDEEQLVISHVRRFVLRAKKLRLNEKEKQIIRTVNPRLSVRYTGYKSGWLSIRWPLPGYRIILLQRSGNLLSSEKADWTVRIISDRTSGQLPREFIDAKGEAVSRPAK